MTGVRDQRAGASKEQAGRRFSSLIQFVCACGLLPTACGLVAFVQPVRADDRAERDKQIDAAIAKALEHLAKNQQPSGAWSLNQFGESTSSTSLAVMAFLAAGHVPGEGPYATHIDRGVRWVLDQQQENGMLVKERGHGPMYSHGISTLMLAEVAGMLDEKLSERCRAALQRAVRVILLAQTVRKDRNNAGGWRYHPSSNDSDLSVTGWQLLALRAAKNLGTDVPAENIDAAVEYVKRCSFRDRGFGYQPGSGSSPTRAGTGILCLEICGVHHSPEALGAADYLLQQPLRADQEWFFYGVYYCTIGMFQVGGKHWERGKEHLIPLLLNLQAEDGSWNGRQGQERGLGTVYATSMAVLALSAEYQFLPIYQR
jgi:prenyltransferase beta subunit